MKQTLNRASVVLAFVLMFFSLSAFADLFDDGFNAGKKFCINNPDLCGLSKNDSSNSLPKDKDNTYNQASFNAGYKEAESNLLKKDKDNTYNQASFNAGYKEAENNLLKKDKDNRYNQASFDAGKTYCAGKGNPCNIPFEDKNGSTVAGIQKCQKDPKSCDITPQDPNAITQVGKDAGKKECTDDPSACSINQQDPNAITQAGKDAGKLDCLKKPTECFMSIQDKLNKDEQETLTTLLNNSKQDCKDKPEECFTKINENPDNKEVPSDCKEKGKNCFSGSTYGLYLNAVVNGENPIDELGNVNTLLSDITMDVLFNDKDTWLFMMKTEYLNNKLNDQTSKKNTQVKNKPLEEINATEESNNLSQNITKAVTTVEEQKQLITSNNAIETAKTIDYYPTTVIYSSEQDKPIQLNISKTGAGEVISYPNGIACGEDCQENYTTNYPVELFAVPIDSNVSLKEWQGDCEGKTNHITVIMDANKTCTAVFE